MVVLKNARELSVMRKAGQISARALKLGGEAVKPGVTTHELDALMHDYIKSQGATPSFLGYGGFPASACISINNEVIHGIPGKRVIHEGDIVSIDVGACYQGYHGDNAATYAAGCITDEAQQLLDATRESLYRGIQAAKPGARLGDVSSAVQTYIESCGFAVVKKYVGHGIGAKLHESPDVPNYGTAGRGIRLLPGMTLAIEPMVNIKGEDVKVLPDGWTVLTASGTLSAHFENTIAITESGAVILTQP